MAKLILFVLLVASTQCYAEVSDQQYARTPAIFHNDNYDHCMLEKEKALYCLFTYELNPLDSSNVTDVWNIIKELNNSEHSYRHDRLRHGICVRETCPNINVNGELAKEINVCYNEKFRSQGLKGTVTEIFCETSTHRNIDLIDIAVGILFIAYIVFVLYASFCESAAMNSKEDYEKFSLTSKGRLYSVFSIPRNFKRIATLEVSAKNEKLLPFQGIRFYNMSIVILTHTVVGALYGPVANPKYTETMHMKWISPFLSSGSLALGTNFYLSAFLMTYGIYTEFEKKEFKFGMVLLICFSRFVRLLPALAATLLFVCTWFRHLGHGPYWNLTVGEEFQYCRKNAWTNMLFLNKIVNKNEMCMLHTWYLALDTQYFLAALILLWVFKKKPRLMWPALCSLSILIMVATFLENYTWDFDAVFYPKAESSYKLQFIRNNPQWHFQMTSSIGNPISSIMGIGVGYLFYKNIDFAFIEKHKSFFTKNFVALTFGPGLFISILPGMLSLQFDLQHNAFWASLYNALGRFIFTCAVISATVLSSRGVGGITEKVMKWRPSLLIGRLSYTAYLIHVPIIFIRNGMNRFPTYLSDFNFGCLFLADVVLTYAAALILTLLFEMPTSELLKVFISDKRKTNEKTVSQDNYLKNEGLHNNIKKE